MPYTDGKHRGDLSSVRFGPAVMRRRISMADHEQKPEARTTRLVSAYLKAEDELNTDSVMLCEVIGDEMQSVSLRVAADAMAHWKKQGEA